MVFGKMRAGLIFTTFAVALLVLTLSAAPAFAQQGDVAGDDQINIVADVQYQAVCQNVIGEINQTAVQDVDAGQGVVAGGDAAAVQEVAAELGVSIEVVNECLNGVADTPDDGDTNGRDTNDDTAKDERVAAAVIEQYGKDAVIVATIPKKVLPNTGGPPLFGLAILSLALIGVGSSVLRAAIRRDR